MSNEIPSPIPPKTTDRPHGLCAATGQQPNERQGLITRRELIERIYQNHGFTVLDENNERAMHARQIFKSIYLQDILLLDRHDSPMVAEMEGVNLPDRTNIPLPSHDIVQSKEGRIYIAIKMQPGILVFLDPSNVDSKGTFSSPGGKAFRVDRIFALGNPDSLDHINSYFPVRNLFRNFSNPPGKAPKTLQTRENNVLWLTFAPRISELHTARGRIYIVMPASMDPSGGAYWDGIRFLANLYHEGGHLLLKHMEGRYLLQEREANDFAITNLSALLTQLGYPQDIQDDFRNYLRQAQQTYEDAYAQSQSKA